MAEFIPGLQLNEEYYWQVVRPILDRHFPNLPHTAALVGYGSDVIGFDTPASRDHMWGPRLKIFLPEEDFEETRAKVHETLRHNLPVSFRGYSTHFGNPDGIGVRLPVRVEQGPVDPLIFYHTIRGFVKQELGVDAFCDPDPLDWLTFQEHRLLTLTGGKVYYDGLGFEEVRRRFAYYPKEVQLYLLAAQWQLISQEEAFVGRTYGVGDDLGSRIITARQVDRIMRLCFIMEKRYAPYSKWYGSAFKRLECYPKMGPLLENAIRAEDYPEREKWLAQAYSLAAEMHNALGITPPVDTSVRTFSGWHQLNQGVSYLPPGDPRDTRPYLVIFAERIVEAIYASIKDPQVLAILPQIGSVNQFFVESSNALQSVELCRRLKDDLLK